MSTYSNANVEIHTVDMGSAVVLSGVTNMSSLLNTSLVSPQTGAVYDSIQSIQSQSPEIPFTTEELAKALDVVSLLTGKCITSDGTHDGVNVYAQKHDPCAPLARSAGSTHMKLTVADGHIMPDAISAQGQANAEFGFRVHGASTDGTTEPVVTTYTAALPTETTREHFVLGTAYIDGTEVTRITGININYNPSITKPQYGATIWPKFVDLQKVSAVITISTDDPTWLDAGKVPLTGKQCQHVNSSIEFIKRLAGSSFYSRASTEHIIGTFEGIAHVSQPFAASGESSGTTEITIATTYDGTNEPIAWTTGTALP